MKPNAWMKTAVALGTAMATALVLAQPAGGMGRGPSPGASPGPGAGSGMMRGDAGGSQRGDCYGYGGGPGMMGGYGGGLGMMGGYGGGPRMMGGYFGGPRMMRGYGGGPGWGGGPGAALAELGLNAEQQQKIAAIHEDMRRKTWDTMGEVRGEQFKLRSLYRAEKPDPNAIAAQQKKVDDLRVTLVKAHVEAGNQMRAVLTSEQRERLRQVTSRSPWWVDEEDGD